MIGRAGSALLLLSLVGCGDGVDGQLVRGAVSVDGQPITSGTINFFSAVGKPLGGPLEPDGSFEYRLPAGKYRVAIRESVELPPGWREGDPLPASAKLSIPPKYSRPDTSGLTVTVVAQEEPLEANFPLITK